MRNLVKVSLSLMLLGGSIFAQQAPIQVIPGVKGPESDTLYNLIMQQATLRSTEVFRATEMVQKHGPLPEEASTGRRSAVVAGSAAFPETQTVVVGPALSAVAGVNFEGPGVGLGGFTMTGAPPDSTMAVGPSHIIAWVNSQFAIFNKNGTVAAPPANGSTIFTGMGGLCETTNRGDPILQFDRMAQRWVLSQFAFNVSAGSPVAPYLQCIAVSTSTNPLGTWNRYSFAFSSVAPEGFNDYGKLGVWPDGYYTAFNIFQGSPAGSFSGAKLCASDRLAMIAGAASPITVCTPAASYGGGGSFLPADLDGNTAPTTVAQGGLFTRYSFGGISLRMIKLKPDYITPALTSYTNGFGGANGTVINIPVGPTTVSCNGSGGTCIPQLGTANLLDTLADRLMYRAAYRNRAGVDSLVVNISVDPDGAGARASAIRWFEVRSPFAAVPTLYQNATFDQGGVGARWMASIAMDKVGNMLMGYSHSDTTANPSIRITGRNRSDIRNRMQPEVVMMAGTGSQTGTLTRWGDYSTMQIDPVDDCTFWYITEYLAADGTFNWRTRIASYKFGNCI